MGSRRGLAVCHTEISSNIISLLSVNYNVGEIFSRGNEVLIAFEGRGLPFNFNEDQKKYVIIEIDGRHSGYYEIAGDLVPSNFNISIGVICGLCVDSDAYRAFESGLTEISSQWRKKFNRITRREEDVENNSITFRIDIDEKLSHDDIEVTARLLRDVCSTLTKESIPYFSTFVSLKAPVELNYGNYSGCSSYIGPAVSVTAKWIVDGKSVSVLADETEFYTEGCELTFK